jgi:uncharacterized DUF497 family protein
MHTKVEWDSKKAAANLEKHGIDFASAAVALQDENAHTIDDPDHEEARYVSLCMDETARILVVVFSADERTVRIISARKATKR